MSARPSLAWLSPVAGVTTSAATSQPVVSLTFDDGPDARVTPAILDVLADRQVHATFFLLAQRAEGHPRLVERILAEGHEVGLHGDTHLRLNRASARQMWDVVVQGKRRLEAVTGEPVRLFRPPGGAQTPASLVLARAARLSVVMWSVSLRDWIDGDVDDMVIEAMHGLSPGDIVLLHDGLATEREVSFDRAVLAGRLLDALAAGGWTVLPAGRLLQTHPAHREVWFKRRLRAAAPRRDAVP